MMVDKQIIRNYLATLTNNVKIGDEDSLLKAKLLDSMNIAELITFLEEQFKITFDNDDLSLENFDTINLIVNHLESKGIS
jgi:acyl carrier protein